ncbi:MAG: hypothetical protein ISS55_05900 [Dehalococcoidales bacterium]|nr:hypothetical protein [Dehalococcoidales bacterium]
MTVTEWITALEWIDIVLIVTILLVLVVIITAIWKTSLKNLISGRWVIFTRLIGTVFVLLVVTYLFSNLQKMQVDNWVLISLYVGLVGITALYAISTHRQADASVKMAEEMRNARSPSITMQWGSANPNSREISANLENEGFGPALNLKCYLTHKEFDFEKKFDGYTTFKVGQKYPLSLPSENFDFKAWNGLAINCDYESVLGERFRSILRCESKENRVLEIGRLNRGEK